MILKSLNVLSLYMELYDITIVVLVGKLDRFNESNWSLYYHLRFFPTYVLKHRFSGQWINSKQHEPY